VQSPFSDQPYVKVTMERRGDAPDSLSPLATTGESLLNTAVTLAVWQEPMFENEPGVFIQTIYAEHPDYEIPTANPGQGLLISRLAGLLADGERPVLYASVGQGCLESPLGRQYPEIPNSQPLSNDLALPVGEHTMTIHDAVLGEFPSCAGKALGPGEPISVADGDRWMLFPYRQPGATEIDQLVIPFGP
jgi:hypothetical protein